MIPSAEAARAYTSPEAGSVLVAQRPGTRGLETSPPQDTWTSSPARVTPTTARLGLTSLENRTECYANIGSGSIVNIHLTLTMGSRT